LGGCLNYPNPNETISTRMVQMSCHLVIVKTTSM
jgi:hypothetical protein